MYNGRRVSVIIPAAGSGRRMGNGPINKVYIELLGKTVLERTFEAFENSSKVDRILVAVRSDEVDFCRDNIICAEKHSKLMDVISGGNERYLTVIKCLELIDEEDIVLIHDGARPIIDEEIIDRCIEAVEKYGYAVTGVPVKDTIKVVSNGFVQSTPDRSKLHMIQTPQAFFAGEIKNCIKKGLKDGFFGTDDSSFAERLEKKVFIVEGKYDNIKVTTSDDINVAEALLMRKEKSEIF